MAKKKGRKKKAIKKTLNLKINLEVDQRPARRKRIVSRRRPNLRELRRSMGGLTAANLKDPSFFGNTALLSNAAMAAMNNKAYALENQMREHTSEVRALQMAGQGESQQVQALQDANSALHKQLELTQGLGSAAYQHGRRATGAAQEETRQLKAKGRAETASDDELKYLGVQVMGEHWTPGAFKKGKFKEVKGTLQELHADPEDADLQARLREQMKGTRRAKDAKRRTADMVHADTPGRDSGRAERIKQQVERAGSAVKQQLGFGDTSLFEDSSDED